MKSISFFASLGVRFGIAAAVVLLSVAFARGQGGVQSPDGAWRILPAHTAEVEAAEPWVRPFRFQALSLDTVLVRNLLANAPLEGTPDAVARPLILGLPNPQGVVRWFRVAEAPVMEPALAAQFPLIKTYVGEGVEERDETLRMDMTPEGFHAQVRTPRGPHWYIDPYSRGDTTHYASYHKKDLKPLHRWACEVAEQTPPPDNAPIDGEGGIGILATGPTLRTYRLAVAATGEYTAFHGGSVASGQAAIVTAVNRVTGVYETELAVRLTLVANNSSLVYTNSATDPYSNGNGSTMLGQNQTNIDTVIGSANYDIGHVFSTGGGGVAGLGVVCGTSKARGVTGQGAPTGDAFWIDYVAHEMGHQFGANHCFNGITSSCGGGNRNASTAFEPGSGSTIMGYAGICGGDDLQPNSDPYFSFISYQEVRAFIDSGGGGTCGTNTSTGNAAPTVALAAPTANGLTIPRGTPFALSATGTDPNGDPLSFSWEQRNQEANGTTLATADNGAMPLFRVFNPTTSATRTFPRLSRILAGTSDNSEKLPQVSRTAFRFRVTARDNRASGGGVNTADLTMAVTSAAGPFTVTSPSGPVSWAAGSTQTVTWNVAGTTANGVNCANVAIKLSTDGGNTYPVTIASSVPNSGTASFVVPNNQTTTGRIRVEAVGNVFFNIGAGVVTITPPVSGVSLTGSGSNAISDTGGNGNGNGRIDPGETSIALNVQVVNSGTVTATGVTATLVSNTGTVTVPTATAAYPNVGPSGGAATNSTPFVLNVSSGHPCGGAISLRLNISSAQGTGVYDFSLPTGQTGGTVTQTFTYGGSVVAIPDNNAAGVSIPLAVSGMPGTITKVVLRFQGSSCSATTGSTTVGLDHTWVGDLIVRLTSPQSTVRTLASRPGGGTLGTDGNNFCQTSLDDTGVNGAIQAIATAGAPYTGSYTPLDALSSFNGQNPNGTWTLTVSDNASQDTGSVRAFSIIVTTTAAPTCDPPTSGAICPSVTDNPSAATLCAGGAFTLNVTATGTAPLAYQWRRGGSPISGATSATYTVASATTGDAGSYDCVVSNSCGSATSNTALVTVNTIPTIGSGPSPVTVCSGGNASFSVSAGGGGTLGYQWRRAGLNISGANGPTYTITGVTTGAAGNYDCVVSNACGSTTSSAVALTVNTPPSVTGQPASVAACVGSPASFSVSATGTGPLSFQWRKGSVNIPGANSAVFGIASVVAGDGAAYDCVVTNACGTATSAAATLTVNTAPTVTGQPAAAASCGGSGVTFTVTATGTVPLSYQWRRDGNPVGGATSASLTIAAPTGANAGEYDCVVTNLCGDVTSNTATLTVNTGPTIAAQPSNQTVNAGDTATFTVGATGQGTLSYQWRRDGVPLSTGGTISGATLATLSISPVQASDAGLYDVVVTDDCGNATSAAASLVVQTCLVDYNGSGGVDSDDLADYIADFFDSNSAAPGFPTIVPIPGGFAGSNTLAFAGFGVPCPGAPDVTQPNAWGAPADAYRVGGYKVGVGVNNPACSFPNADDLADYIGIFFTGCP